VHKFTYRGKTCEQISEAIDNTQTNINPSHVIIHCGTNNLPIDSAEVCATKIINLATKVKINFLMLKSECRD
jgi:sialic acid synthase SpsE